MIAIMTVLENEDEKVKELLDKMERPPINRVFDVRMLLVDDENMELIGIVFYRKKLRDIGIFILPEWRGKKYGTLLLKEFLKKMDKGDYERLEASIPETNIICLKLFEYFGFYECKRNISGDETEIILRRYVRR